LYVPEWSLFGQTVTLRDNHPTDPDYVLNCPAPSVNDPGSSKYFALVRNTSGPNRMAQVWKAYPDFTDPDEKKWYWRLIDERWEPGNPSGGAASGIRQDFTAVLDNCGRVVFCDTAHCTTPDQIRIGVVWTPLPGGGVNDGGNSEFYGWSPSGNFGTSTCTGDNIVGVGGTTPEPYTNDSWTNDFSYVSSTIDTDLTNPIIATPSISARTCGSEVCPAVPPFPGTGTSDGTADFSTTTRLTDAGWQISGGKIYSPLYGAVLFVYGDVDLSGNLSNIVFNDGVCTAIGCVTGAQQDISNTYVVPPNTWKVSAISYGHVDIGGGVRYSPAFGTNASYQYAVVAGRDINLRGSSNNFSCNATDCDGAPTGSAPDYSGIFVVHEQVDASGSVGVNGFMIAEDRVDCDDFVRATGGALNNQGTGNIQVHYDCENPADPWATKGVRLREWEELQR
ncbi:MAG: hypothetical protein L0287_34040, partial [Anaerolineae bacterium]|nr:hypothetical protein [Anaerolineae bacterium]